MSTLEKTDNVTLVEDRPVLRDEGQGRTILLLHGGGGAATVSGLAGALAAHTRVLTPTHPGFDGTPRPARLDSVAALADLYLNLLESLDVRDVIIVGSSLGGWVGAEMVLKDSGRIRGLVLINACGIAVPGETVADVFRLSPLELARLAFHNPEVILGNAPPPTAEQVALRAGNLAALAAYDQGAGMQVPDLRERLAVVDIPALVIWGESDRVVSPGYGRAYAAAFPHGRFEVVPAAGHLPHIEQPDKVLASIHAFMRNEG